MSIDRSPSGDPSALLTALQLGDSFFPSGRYTLSHGLEAFVRQDKIHDAAELEAVLGDYLTEAIGKSEAVAVASANRLAGEGDVDGLVDLDRLLFAMRLPAEASASSVRTGRQLVSTGRRLALGGTFDGYAEAVDDGRAPGNHAVVFGVAACSWGLTPLEATVVELHAYTAGLLGVALRTIRLDHLDAQAVLRRLAPVIVATATKAIATDYEEMSAFAPLIEVMQMTHERGHLRLFAS